MPAYTWIKRLNKKKYAFRNYAWQNWDIFFGLQTFLVNLRKDLEETKEKWNRIWKFRYFQERFISFWKYWRFILQVNEYIYLICFQTGSYYCCFDWYSGCELSCDCAQDFNWCVRFGNFEEKLHRNQHDVGYLKRFAHDRSPFLEEC